MKKELLKEYAEFAVIVGTNPQPRQTLIITCPIECAEFGRMCAETAYQKTGVREVVIKYDDEIFSRIRYKYTEKDVLEDIKPWRIRRDLDYLESDGGACYLHVWSSDPEAYLGLDEDKINGAVTAASLAAKPIKAYTMYDRVQWAIAAVPNVKWAKKVFPDMKEEDAVEALWSKIFDVCRVSVGNTVSEWKKHIKYIASMRDKMNGLNLESIHMENSLGTNLTVPLAEDSKWEGANSVTPEGYNFIANIPTEEVYTAPHRGRTEGIAYAAKPYVFNGNIIEKFWVRFSKGEIVEFAAEKGEEILRQLLDTDEGAKHLGEVALVPVSSPIKRSGILFYETLFDENAACHIAFGDGYPTTIKGGAVMNRAKLDEKGLNDSIIHEDVMVGTEDMKITGRTKDGKEVVLFKNGEWAI